VDALLGCRLHAKCHQNGRNPGWLKTRKSDKIVAYNILDVQQFLCRNAGAGTLEKSAFSLTVAKMSTKTLNFPRKSTHSWPAQNGQRVRGTAGTESQNTKMGKSNQRMMGGEVAAHAIRAAGEPSMMRRKAWILWGMRKNMNLGYGIFMDARIGMEMYQ
jgi:hypothetical protein